MQQRVINRLVSEVNTAPSDIIELQTSLHQLEVAIHHTDNIDSLTTLEKIYENTILNSAFNNLPMNAVKGQIERIDNLLLQKI